MHSHPAVTVSPSPAEVIREAGPVVIGARVVQREARKDRTAHLSDFAEALVGGLRFAYPPYGFGVAER